MMAALDGLKILIPESRELDLFANMLAAEGATAERCPLVRIMDLDNTSVAEDWMTGAIAAPFDYTILLTGEGVRRLVALSGNRRDSLIAALGKTRIVTRGPKPVRALREIGLTSFLNADIPTSEGILAALAQYDLARCRIGAQLYPGAGAQILVTGLTARGAEVFPVTPYRYASDMENAAVAETIRTLAAGGFDLVAFTASAQLDRLFTVARDSGLEMELKAGLHATPIAAVGPVVEKALASHGLQSVIQPDASFHLKPLVRAICAWRQA
jgi:uroporphyrinogen-III synthase